MKPAIRLDHVKQTINRLQQDTHLSNKRIMIARKTGGTLLDLLRYMISAGILYIILGPMITIVANSFFSAEDLYNPLVYLFPKNPTLERYSLAFMRLSYQSALIKTLTYDLTLTALQIMICSMVGYGFARYDFPLKKLLFGLVILTIVIPSHTIMLPLYMNFRQFDIFGLIRLVTGQEGVNLLATQIPMYILTLLGCGLRSGLYIYLFNQFFRGIPKEIEEAAFIDGAGPGYTYFRIMLVNAVPPVITVAVLSLVWQYNDIFYAQLFAMRSDSLISLQISSLAATISYVDKVMDPRIVQLYLFAGIVLAIIPIIAIYVLLQKYFMESFERSGIVG